MDMPQSPGAVRASVLVSLAALSTLAVGLLILGGGSARFSDPLFQSSRAVAPWWTWGLAMVVSGAVASIGAVGHLMWMSRIGHSMSSVVYLLLVMTFVDSVLRAPSIALTGIGIYTGFALIHAWSAASADLEKTTREAAAAAKQAVQRLDEIMRDDEDER